METTLRLLIFAIGFLIVFGIYLDGRKLKQKRKLMAPAKDIHNRMERFERIAVVQTDEREPDFEIEKPIPCETLSAVDTTEIEITYESDEICLNEAVTNLEATDADVNASQTFTPMVITLSVMAREGRMLSGRDVLDGLALVGLEFDPKRHVFVRFEQGIAKLGVQFTAVQAVEPGFFDLGEMPYSQFPGISFFMVVPGPRSSLHAFDDMLRIAKTMSARLRADLIGEGRRPMTHDDVQDLRQKIKDHESTSMKQAV